MRNKWLLTVCFSFVVSGCLSCNLFLTETSTIPAETIIQIHTTDDDSYKAAINGDGKLIANEQSDQFHVSQSQTLKRFGISRAGVAFDTTGINEEAKAVVFEAVVWSSTDETVVIYPSAQPFIVKPTVPQSLWRQRPPSLTEVDIRPTVPEKPYILTVTLPTYALKPGRKTYLLFRLASEGVEPPDYFHTGDGGDVVNFRDIKLIVEH